MKELNLSGILRQVIKDNPPYHCLVYDDENSEPWLPDNDFDPAYGTLMEICACSSLDQHKRLKLPQMMG